MPTLSRFAQFRTKTEHYSDLIAAADDGNISLIAILDLSVVLDCIDHEIIIQCLPCSNGLGQPILSWPQSYITGRTQIVRCNTDR